MFHAFNVAAPEACNPKLFGERCAKVTFETILFTTVSEPDPPDKKIPCVCVVVPRPKLVMFVNTLSLMTRATVPAPH